MIVPIKPEQIEQVNALVLSSCANCQDGCCLLIDDGDSFPCVQLLADIGNGTMNTLYLVNGKPQSGKMFTEKFGAYQCTLAIREGFMRKTRRELNDYLIDEVLRTGTVDIPDSDLEIITAIAEEYVTEIFRRLREHGYDESTMKLYVCGGGGCLIKNFYHGNLDRVKFIDDICAAAKGYEYLADVYLRAEAKNEGRV